MNFLYHRRVEILRVQVNPTVRHSCRQTPLLVTWVGVCIGKDGGHDAAAATCKQGAFG